MRQRQYVAYYRVSTPRQGYSGLGLDAQRASVVRYVQKVSGKLVAEFEEVKSGLKTNRPQLAEAIRTCRMRRAVLVIARLDRLARNVALIADLMDSELEFVAVDFPAAGRLTLHVLAAIAEYESKLMSERTRAALAAAKARGVRLGSPHGGFANLRAAVAASVKTRKNKALTFALDVAPTIWELLAKGKSQNEVAAELNRQRIQTPLQCTWDSEGVRRVMRLTEKALPLLAEAAAAGPDWRTVRARERAEELAPIVWNLRRDGLSLTSIAEEMNRRRIPTPRGGKWQTSSVHRILYATKAVVPDARTIIKATRIGRRAAHSRQRALDLAPLVEELREQGKTLRAIAVEFNKRGIRSGRGKPWCCTSVRQVLVLAAKAEAERTGVRLRTPFRMPPLDPKTRAMAVAPRIWKLRALGKSTAAIADELNRDKVKTLKCGRWHAATVERVLNLTTDRFPHHAKAAARAPNPWMVRALERASELAPLVRQLKATMTLAEVAAELTGRGVPTPRGARQWWSMTVWKVLKRADEAAEAQATVRPRRSKRNGMAAPRRLASTMKKAA